MKTNVEALAEESGHKAIAHVATMVLVLGLWAANVFFFQHKPADAPAALEDAAAELPAPAQGSPH